MKKIIKYLFNVICLGYLFFGIRVSYAIIVTVPNLERLFDIIWIQVGRVSLISIVFIIFITYLNFLFERKIEKRKSSREFIIISFIHVVFLILAYAYFSYDFYSDYIEHPEYF